MVQHEHVRLLQNLGAADTLMAEEHICGDRPLRRRLGDHKRLERVEARELLVHAGLRVVAVDDGVRSVEPAAAFGALGASGTYAAARRRFHRAITFVNALSSTPT